MIESGGGQCTGTNAETAKCNEEECPEEPEGTGEGENEESNENNGSEFGLNQGQAGEEDKNETKNDKHTGILLKFVIQI